MWQRLNDTNLGELKAYLEIHSPASSSMYGNLLAVGIRYRPLYMRSGIYYGYFEDDTLCGVVAIYNDGNIMVHINSDAAKDAVSRIIKVAVHHSVWGLSGWLPDRKDIKRDGLTMDERTLVIMEREKSTDLGEIPPITFERIDHKRMNKKHYAVIKQCLWEGFGFESRRSDIKRRMKERTKLEPYWIAYVRKRPVGQVHVHAMTTKYGYIGGVCTLRSERKKGYGTRAVMGACRFIEKLGRISALSVSEKNDSAIALYEKIGFHSVGYMKVYMREREFKGDENQ